MNLAVLEGRDWLSTDETAALFGRSKSWVRIRLCRGDLQLAPPGRSDSRRIQISTASIRVELARQAAAPEGAEKSNWPPFLRLVVDNT